MPEHFLSIDIGASGGRHYAGCIENDKLVLEEIYRFGNGTVSDGENLIWDTDRIFSEILTGMGKCADRGIKPVSVGIDTWGVDYILIDEAGERIGKAFAYRDNRTLDMDIRFDDVMSASELYEHTGIQRISINTLYQLMAHMDKHPGDFDKARRLLMLPDYFHFLLAGEMCSEYTVATTSQLVNANSRNWDDTVIQRTGVDRSLFGDLHLPGTMIGKLRGGVADQVGYSCDVVLPCSHDTASAVAAVPGCGGADSHVKSKIMNGVAGVGNTGSLNGTGGCKGSLFLSSGTWSLMGCETETPLLSEASRKLNYTNEGGYNGSNRLLKNIMGLWMIQSVRRELAPEMCFDDIARAAQQSGKDVPVDCADAAFLSPDSMYGAVREWCDSHGFRPPEGIGETAAYIYSGLAQSYADSACDIEELTGEKFTNFHIVGGGSKDDYLNMLTAEKTGMTVHAGPAEAAALGNIIAQMITAGVFSDLDEARACIAESFEIKEYNGGEYGEYVS